MLAWSNCSDVLAVGTVKGNLQLYFVKERRKMPVAAKHTKRVCAGSWALNENILALAAHDRTVSGPASRMHVAAPFRHEPEVTPAAPVPAPAPEAAALGGAT